MLDGSYWSRRLSGAFAGSFAFKGFGALDAGGSVAVDADVDGTGKGGTVGCAVAVATPGEPDPTTGTTGETASCGRIPTKSPIAIAATADAAASAQTQRGRSLFGGIVAMT